MSTIADFFGVSAVKDGREVGIEIEMEGEALPTSSPPTGWKAEADGSLRGNSCEMVFRRPEPRQEIRGRLSALSSYMKKIGTRLAETDRCGVHIHVNVQEFSMQQTFNFILLYLLFEEVLVHYCGETREGNLFCLRAKDASHLIQQLRICKAKGRLDLIANDTFRYASINMAALSKYGSLEFRALKTPDDIMEIEDWANMMLALKDYSIKIGDAREIVEGFSMTGEKAFLRRVFGSALAKKLQCDGYEAMLRDGARRIQDICYTKSAEYKPEPKKVRVAPNFLGLQPVRQDFRFDRFGNVRDRTRQAAEAILSGRFENVSERIPAGFYLRINDDNTGLEFARTANVDMTRLVSQNSFGLPGQGPKDRSQAFADYVKSGAIADPGQAPDGMYWNINTFNPLTWGEHPVSALTERDRQSTLVTQYEFGFSPPRNRAPDPTETRVVEDILWETPARPPQPTPVEEAPAQPDGTFRTVQLNAREGRPVTADGFQRAFDDIVRGDGRVGEAGEGQGRPNEGVRDAEPTGAAVGNGPRPVENVEFRPNRLFREGQRWRFVDGRVVEAT